MCDQDFKGFGEHKTNWGFKMKCMDGEIQSEVCKTEINKCLIKFPTLSASIINMFHIFKHFITF